MRPDTCASKNIAWVSGARRGTKLSEEYERWEARYSAPDYIFGKAPNYFLVKCKPLLPASGRVLAVGNGEGRKSGWRERTRIGVEPIAFFPTPSSKGAEVPPVADRDV